MIRVLDLFAGARGWDIAARRLGCAVDPVENWPVANETAEAAGFGPPVCLDVRDFHPRPLLHDTHLGSPSCKRFAASGNGAGRRAIDQILTAIRMIDLFGYVDLSAIDADAALTVEPLRVALEGTPRAIGWEQVPAVLPIWQACADVLRGRGYSVWTGVVDAADFGVPQHRKRAVLLARRDRGDIMPIPYGTHYPNTEPRHKSMASEIGWGMTGRPAYTVTGGGTYTGGAEPWGNGARRGMRREFDAGRWLGAWRARPTADEAAALQTFPADYPFAGNQGQQFQQIGNAVPPLLAEALIRELIA